MSDRQLLEDAAKAAGIEVRRGNGFQKDRLFQDTPCNDGIVRGMEWNPLENDGDALRLAVKLGIDVQQFVSSHMVEAWKYPHQACGEDYGADPYAATRRAITHAAAAIGSGKESAS